LIAIIGRLDCKLCIFTDWHGRGFLAFGIRFALILNTGGPEAKRGRNREDRFCGAVDREEAICRRLGALGSQRAALKVSYRKTLAYKALQSAGEQRRRRIPPDDSEARLPITTGELTRGCPSRSQLACFILLQQNFVECSETRHLCRLPTS
jgi:hypothetical protein